MHKLSILIPMYHEGEDVVKPLLDSIEVQQNIDFNDIEVVITRDGILEENSEYKLSEEFLNHYSFEIKYLEMEHGGVSAARNYCLDNCDGEYVMFCDCDDSFLLVTGLWIVFREIEIGFDSLTSLFVEESRDKDGNIMYIQHPMDSTFVHGKIHKKQYLVDNNIRWNPKLTIHEDSYFNLMCQRFSPNVKYCDTAFYLWRWRDNSVCRHDPLYINKTFTNMLDSNTALVKEFLNRGKMDEAKQFASSMIFDCYFNMNTDKWWTEDGKQFVEKTEKRFAKYWDDFGYFLKQLTKEEEIQMLSAIRGRFYAEGLSWEKITFQDWIKHIEEIPLD